MLCLSLLPGCAVLPGQSGDYGKFCDVSGTAHHDEIYLVAGVHDYWLTSAGNYLSVGEYSQTSTRAG
jgi:hypothetical protein